MDKNVRLEIEKGIRIQGKNRVLIPYDQQGGYKSTLLQVPLSCPLGLSTSIFKYAGLYETTLGAGHMAGVGCLGMTLFAP